MKLEPSGDIHEVCRQSDQRPARLIPFVSFGGGVIPIACHHSYRGSRVRQSDGLVLWRVGCDTTLRVAPKSYRRISASATLCVGEGRAGVLTQEQNPKSRYAKSEVTESNQDHKKH